MADNGRPERPGLQVAGGMAIGCGALVIAGALALVAAAFSVDVECPPPTVACGEGGPLSVLLATPMILFGALVAGAGLLMHRAGRKR